MSIAGTIPTAADPMAVLAVLADPKQYGERLAELRRATEEYNAVVTKVAPASEMMSRLEEARTDRKHAAAELEAAKREAAMLLQAAQDEAVRVRQEAAAQLGKVTAEGTKKQKELQEWEKRLDAQAEQLRSDQESAKRAQDAATQAADAAEEASAASHDAALAFRAHLEDLNQVTAKFAKALEEMTHE